MKNKINWSKITVSQMILIVFLIILIFPILLTIPAISHFLNFSDKGQIGDTIGGITAPFINGLAAILVFLAFKEQIKANDLYKSQEKNKMILDQISIIQHENLEIENIIFSLNSRKNQFLHSFSPEFRIPLHKIMFFITEIKLATSLIDGFSGDKDFVYSKLYYLYTIRYRESFNLLLFEFDDSFVYHKDYSKYIPELVSNIKELNDYFSDKNKFKSKY
jgi:hypothetical protein